MRHKYIAEMIKGMLLPIPALGEQFGKQLFESMKI